MLQSVEQRAGRSVQSNPSLVAIEPQSHLRDDRRQLILLHFGKLRDRSIDWPRRTWERWDHWDISGHPWMWSFNQTLTLCGSIEPTTTRENCLFLWSLGFFAFLIADQQLKISARMTHLIDRHRSIVFQQRRQSVSQSRRQILMDTVLL